MVQGANRSEMGRRNGGSMLSAQGTERALLAALLARLRTLDADVYVGHNISAFDLDVLLHRLQHHKACTNLWKRAQTGLQAICEDAVHMVDVLDEEYSRSKEAPLQTDRPICTLRQLYLLKAHQCLILGNAAAMQNS